MAGKGSKPRPTNMQKYCSNFDLIVWDHKKKTQETENKIQEETQKSKQEKTENTPICQS